jgi:acetolactate synthase-1/2/3 large subunit
VWILYLKEGYQTSMHCHPNKKTSLVVLSGEAMCSTLEDTVVRRAGQGLVLGKGVFHRTRSISEGGVFVAEIEAPVNKRDLVRARDDYGREQMGYEGMANASFNVHNYNYISFIDSEIYYNTKKRFGDCSIELQTFTHPPALIADNEQVGWDTITLLKGQLLNGTGAVIYDVGDTLCREDLTCHEGVRFVGSVEVIITRAADSKSRLSDFVISYLKNEDVREFFYVSDTTNAHLIDALGRDTDVSSLPLRTEHAVTLSAEACAKFTHTPCVAIVSSGASAINAMAGVANAWVDSTPLVVLSAQSRPSELGVPDSKSMRQLFNKEIDIASIVKPITKYVKTIQDPLTIKRELHRAVACSHKGRPGPVWIDIPIDILGTNIDENELWAPEPVQEILDGDCHYLSRKVAEILVLLENSRRPVLLVGHGIRAAQAQAELADLVECLSIPVLTSRRGIDLINQDCPYYFGRPGTYGQRAANFVIQNADLILCIGTRLSVPMVGRNYQAFARVAKKIAVDIDRRELNKATVPLDISIEADAKAFIEAMLACRKDFPVNQKQDWLQQCRLWVSKYPPNMENRPEQTGGCDPYAFIDSLSITLNESEIIVVDGGPVLDYVMQSFKIRPGQRIISSPGLEHQGFSLPGAIGVSVFSRMQRIICLCDKKGLQRNISELETLAAYKVPVKVFVFNCGKSTCLRQIQKHYFGKRYIGHANGDDSRSLNIKKLGEVYGIATCVINGSEHIRGKIDDVICREGPVLCDVQLPDDLVTVPRLAFTVQQDGKWISTPLEDMYPFLDREELEHNMLIDVVHRNAENKKTIIHEVE